MSPDDLTLAKTVEIAFQLESTAGLPSQLASSSPSLSQPMLLTQLVGPSTRSPSPGSPQDSPEVNFARRPNLPCQMVEVSTLWQIQKKHFVRVCNFAPAAASPAKTLGGRHNYAGGCRWTVDIIENYVRIRNGTL